MSIELSKNARDQAIAAIERSGHVSAANDNRWLIARGKGHRVVHAQRHR